MKLEHVALYVQDLEAMKEFYVRFFQASANQKYHNPRSNFMSYFLSFDGECRLELMQRPNTQAHSQAEYQLGYTHISFQLGSREKVDALTQELQQAGYALLNGPRLTGDGYYESVFADPEGNQVELVA